VFLIVALAGAVIVSRRRFPEVAVGIVWFCLFLLPVIGLVQVGLQARADRYMYLPMIGLIWIAVRISERICARIGRSWRYAIASVTAVWLVCAGIVAQQQVQYWKNSFLLSVHSIKLVGPETTLIGMLGGVYLELEEPEKALPLFDVIAHRPGASLRNVVNYAQCLHGVGRLREAINVCREVLAYDSRDYYAHASLSVWLREAGEAEEAEKHAEQMRAIGPPYGHVPFVPGSRIPPKGGGE